MAYYSILGFNREPFSTSPDPAFFYLTKEHDMALTNILIELHLKRGLSVIFGDVGTGKTSLSRMLVQELSKRGNMLFHVVLNPVFSDEHQFLKSLVRNFNADTTLGLDLSNADILEFHSGSFPANLVRGMHLRLTAPGILHAHGLQRNYFRRQNQDCLSVGKSLSKDRKIQQYSIEKPDQAIHYQPAGSQNPYRSGHAGIAGMGINTDWYSNTE